MIGHQFTTELWNATARLVTENYASNVTAELTAGLMHQLLAKKKVTIKVGMIGEAPPKLDEFVIGFDPQTPLQLTPNKLLLPFIATTSMQPAKVPFYFSQRRTCSSMNRHRGHTNKGWYDARARAACMALAKTLPKSEWWLHDHRAKTFAELSRVAGGCFFCQDARLVQKDSPIWNTLALGDLIRAIASPITLLDLDAQGSDVALIESVGDALRWVRRVKLECQEPTVVAGFMYKTEVPNRCSRAEKFLISAGFQLEERRLNNCGCEEYNLFMVRR